MKHLQNNFTTPEQSKRLWELGLPVDSADLVYFELEDVNIDDVIEGRRILSPPLVNCTIVGTDAHNVSITELKENNGDLRVFPCWSVGRLIELLDIYTEGTGMFGTCLCNLIGAESLIETLVKEITTEFRLYKCRQQKADNPNKLKQQISSKVSRSVEVLTLANKEFEEIITHDDVDDYVGMQDFLY